MLENYKTTFRSQWAYLLYGVIVGALIILGIRYVTYSPEETHYHANFAVYINGQREEFKSPQYYEEVKICSLHDTITPQVRTHMHDEENGVIHVHDDAVTWSDFFNNLGWSLGPDFIRDRTTLHVADADNKLNIVLNGDNLTGLTSLADQVIGNEDRLLISYGVIDKAELAKEYASVPSDAHIYNHKQDPASCSGMDSSTPVNRLKHLF